MPSTCLASRSAGPRFAFRSSLITLFAIAPFALPSSASAQAFSVGLRFDYPTGTTPNAVAIGDVNGDGYPDLVVANSNSSTVSVLLGNAAGVFGAKADFATGSTPISVAIGDVNGDGYPDLVAANVNGNSVSVLLGNGAGSFAAKTDFACGNNPYSVAIGDVNGDGRPDLVVANNGSNTVSVLLGNGAGGFGPRTDFATGFWPASVALGDVNGDGHLDVVVANSLANTVTVLLGDGTGAFTATASSPATGNFPNSVALGDVNGDGRPDLVTANLNDNTVTVLLGDGTGAFTAPPGSTYAVGASPTAVAIGDVNGDGSPDLVVANHGDNTVSVLLGSGYGGFAAASVSPLAVGAGPYPVAVADLNGDGHLDVVVGNNGGNTVSVLMGNGTGGFAAHTDFATAPGAIWVAIGDLNGDGHPDLAVSGYGVSTNTVTVLLGDGTGAYTPASGSPFTTASKPWQVAIGDLNGDGHPDLAVVTVGGVVSVLLNNGAGSFNPRTDYATGVGVGSTTIAIADMNGDGKPDLVMASSTTIPSGSVAVLLGNGLGGFSAVTGSPFSILPDQPISLAVADVDGDGKLDVVTVNISQSTASVLHGNGDGTIGTKTDYPTGASPRSVAIADMNGDGHPDLATANAAAGTVSVLLNNGAGGFGLKTDYVTGTTASGVAIGDLNGDGYPDLAVTNRGSNTVSVLLGNGAGGFGPQAGLATGTGPIGVAIGDLNGDGRLDIAAANITSNNVSVLLGLEKTHAALTVSAWPFVQGQTFTLTAPVTVLAPGSGALADSVSFFDGFTPIARVPVVAGVATLTLPAPYAGLRSFGAAYRGDGRLSGAVSAMQPRRVYPASLAGVPPPAPLAFALEPLAPNPARGGAARVSFTLPTAAHATLEVVDVSGRRIVTRDVGALGAGRHSVDLAAGRAISPGLYWVRLTQGGERRVRRVAIVE